MDIAPLLKHEPKLPPMLYKYRCFNKYHLKVVKDNRIFFASPDQLNDPLDCALHVQYEIGTQNQMYKKDLEMILSGNPDLPRKEAKRLALSRARKMSRGWADQSKVKAFRQGTSDRMNEIWSVFSLSARRDSTLMWSHYSDAHKGFCVGFNAKRLKQFYDTSSMPRGIHLMMLKVKYFDELPILNPYKLSDVELVATLLSSKRSDWSYEEEYRLLRFTEPNQVVRLDLDIIDSVTLGLDCPIEKEEEMKEILRHRGRRIALHRVDEILRSGEMRFKQIDY